MTQHLALFVGECLALGLVLLALFHARVRVGGVFLLLALGVLQLFPNLLMRNGYLELLPGFPTSPGAVAVSASVLMVAVLYLLHGTMADLRRLVLAVAVANLGVYLFSTLAVFQVLASPGVLNRGLVSLFQLVDFRGVLTTLGVLVLDLSLLALMFEAGVGRLAGARFWLAAVGGMVGVALVDGAVTTLLLWGERNDAPRLMAGALLSRGVAALVYGLLLLAYSPNRGPRRAYRTLAGLSVTPHSEGGRAALLGLALKDPHSRLYRGELVELLSERLDGHLLQPCVSVVAARVVHLQRHAEVLGEAALADLMRAVGERLDGVVRSSDLVVRWTADTFVVLLLEPDQATRAGAAERVASKINRVTVALPHRNRRVEVRFQTAVCETPGGGQSLRQQVEAACALLSTSGEAA
jgi:GGDEF domain-containing protein